MLGGHQPQHAQLADKMGLLGPELTTLCRRGDPRLSEVTQLARCLCVPPTYFLSPIAQTGAFNIADIGNTQKIKIGKAAAHQLAAQLNVCQGALDAANRLVDAKDEIIDLLRRNYCHHN